MSLKVIFHAPTAEALTRARRNLVNFRAADDSATLQIIANAAAVGAALDNPDPATDDALLICRTTLDNTGRRNDRGLAEIDSAVVDLAWRQANGWQYIRT
jgi:NitT/TauT family transport system ATP-binding protein